jgi:hypothetical protein
MKTTHASMATGLCYVPSCAVRRIRAVAAFQDFAKRMGLVDYWKHNRWPDLGQPAPERGPDSFTCR